MNALSKILASCALLAGASVWSGPLELRAIVQEGSAPKFLESPGVAKGHCPDILRAIEGVDKDLHFDINPNPTPIKRIEKDLQEGRLDVMCALLETPTRNEIAYRITTPLYSVRERLVGLRGDTLKIRNFDDLAQANVLVATQSGASYADTLRSHQIRVDESTTSTALQNIARKRVRYFYTNELTAGYYIKTEGLDSQLQLMPGVLQETPSYLWVDRQTEKAVVQRIEAAVAKLKKDGVLERIYRNYAGNN